MLSALLLASLIQIVEAPDTYLSLPTEEFKTTWFDGKAEINVYSLEQTRYGETRDGHAILIFVTEDFLPDKQVKADEPDRAKSGAIPVLKMNAIRKFTTGIYDYSIMTSVFTPIQMSLNLSNNPEYVQILKSTTSVQEWCGHSFLQINLSRTCPKHYEVTGRSYFESEGDDDYQLPGDVMLESSVWSLLRLHPMLLKPGRKKMIPDPLYSRLSHTKLKSESVGVSNLPYGDGVSVVSINYPDLNRTLEIQYETQPPHGILGWTESYPEGSGMATVKATRTHVERIDYWNFKKNEDEILRKRLGIE